jgi:hypothetical protein
MAVFVVNVPSRADPEQKFDVLPRQPSLIRAGWLSGSRDKSVFADVGA